MALRSLTSAGAGVVAALAAAPITYAQIGQPDPGLTTPKNPGGLRAVVVNIINYMLTFVGLIAVAMLIYGGFLYLTSAGSETITKKAKTTILYAIVGIVVIALSFVIVNTIIKEGTSTIQGTVQQ